MTKMIRFVDLIWLFKVYQALTTNLARGDGDTAFFKARTALEYVEKIINSACSGRTEETLPVEFDHDLWKEYAVVAVRMSNLLTKSAIRNNNTLWGVTDEFLFDLVRNNVDNDYPIFGSAIAVEEWVYPKYRIFCPYSYKKENTYAHDISLNYNYLDPSTEWYYVLRMRNWTDAYVSRNWITYRYNMTSHDKQRILPQPMALLGDGHWTLPYYDCGGGDIWMVTYSAPIFGMDSSGYPIFKGIGTIDIELTDIDINQCDLDEETDLPQEASEDRVDVFRGTHQCLASTKCVPIPKMGFLPGAYKCVCRLGYYYPDVSLPISNQYFNGSALEALHSSGTKNNTDNQGKYICLPCAEGCDSCIDHSPCLYSYVLPMRVSLLVVSMIPLALSGLAVLMVTIHKKRKAIKSASPMFLQILSAGACLMASTMFVSYVTPSDFTCSLQPWLLHIGFSLAYGALLLKTWRIATIFRVKSARRMNLSDKVLAQRFIPILAVPIAYLAVWMFVARPQVIWLKTAGQELKFKFCQSSWWAYGALIGEGLFLLWGAYLCFSVRKAPSHFNESKYITWAIYNNILLGSFIIVAKEFIAMAQGPDVIYIVDFVYIQVVVTGLISLIFLPKTYAVFRGSDDGSEETVTAFGIKNNTATVVETLSDGKVEKVEGKDETTQTDMSYTTVEDL